ncbi:MAG TPA: restriction endonuclease, partial [archaeon]|nr:restriction endonuclease [archaeon]
DVIAENKNEKIAIQVKRFNIEKMVTPNIIRETLGAMNRFGATKCMVITTSGFTAAAEEATTNERIILWDKATLHKNVKKYFIDEELKILSKT